MQIDIVEKIPLSDLLSAFISNNDLSVYDLLKANQLINYNFKPSYFDYGRNAFYQIFLKLPYKTIGFSAFVCPSIVNSALKAGKKVKLLEVELNTFNLSLDQKFPECLVVVHAFGNPVDINLIKKNNKNIFIIEDCAHSLFSKIREKYVGNLGDIVIYSLYKQIPNLAGSLVLSDFEFGVFNKTKLSRYWQELIFKTASAHQTFLNLVRKNKNINTQNKINISSKLLSYPHIIDKIFIQGFKRLKKNLKTKQNIAKIYTRYFADSPYFIPQQINLDNQSSYYQYALRINPKYCHYRDQLLINLRRKNIFIDRVWYDSPIIKNINNKQSCPNARLLANSIICLPTSTDMSNIKIKFLIDNLNQELKRIIK
jgi:perosamine synthetase